MIALLVVAALVCFSSAGPPWSSGGWGREDVSDAAGSWSVRWR